MEKALLNFTRCSRGWFRKQEVIKYSDRIGSVGRPLTIWTDDITENRWIQTANGRGRLLIIFYRPFSSDQRPLAETNCTEFVEFADVCNPLETCIMKSFSLIYSINSSGDVRGPGNVIRRTDRRWGHKIHPTVARLTNWLFGYWLFQRTAEIAGSRALIDLCQCSRNIYCF